MAKFRIQCWRVPAPGRKGGSEMHRALGGGGQYLKEPERLPELSYNLRPRRRTGRSYLACHDSQLLWSLREFWFTTFLIGGKVTDFFRSLGGGALIPDLRSHRGGRPVRKQWWGVLSRLGEGGTPPSALELYIRDWLASHVQEYLRLSCDRL